MSAAAAVRHGAAAQGWSAAAPQWRLLAPVLLALCDLGVLEGSLLLGVQVRTAVNPWFAVSLASWHFRGIAWGLLIVPVVFLAAGLYPGYGLSTVERLRRRVQSIFFAFAGMIAWGYLVYRERWSRGVLLGTFLFAVVLLPLAERLWIAILIRLRMWGTGAVIMGNREASMAVAEQLRSQPALGFVPLAAVDLDREEEWEQCAALAQVAIVPAQVMRDAQRSRAIQALPFRCIIVLSDAGWVQTQSVGTLEIGDALGLALNRNLLIRRNRMIKRAIDVVGSAVLLAVLAPVIAACAAWVRLISSGNPFYWQERMGFGGRAIRMWKLRTMHRNAAELLEMTLDADPAARREWQGAFKLRQDPRVLRRGGRFLRRSSLDELPQLWNVLRGEMSLVGPRPLPEYHLETFDKEFRQLRECVRPGITGLWQVTTRSNGGPGLQKALDTYYICNWSLWLDLEIACRTVLAVARGRGAY